MKATAMGTAAICVLICSTSVAETWPTLEEYVRICDLIVLCEAEFVNDTPIFRITEQWKGAFKETDFNKHLRSRIPKPGYLPEGLGLHSGRKVHPGQKVVFFFTHVKVRKYDGSSTSFDVRDGKLMYAETGHPGMPKEYTLNEFRKAILELVKSEKKN